jgi:hypothetical protein
MKKKYQVINAKIEKLKTQYNPQKTKEHHNNVQEKHTFFKRTENLTNITFTEDKMQLLNKGLKYNLHYKPKNWLQTLGLEAEIRIKQLPLNKQSYMRQTVANNIQKLVNKQHTRNK